MSDDSRPASADRQAGASEVHPVALAVVDTLAEQLAAEQAASCRLREALESVVIATKDDIPSWMAYESDDGPYCRFCNSYSGNPYIAEEVAAWRHADGCVFVAAKDALASAPGPCVHQQRAEALAAIALDICHTYRGGVFEKLRAAALADAGAGDGGVR